MKFLIILYIFSVLFSRKLQLKNKNTKKRNIFNKRYQTYMPLFDQKKQLYIPYQCDQNIYKLSQKLLFKNSTDHEYLDKNKFYAVVMTSENDNLSIRQCGNPNSEIQERNSFIWNYHVILIHKQLSFSKWHQDSYVYDFDSNLGFVSEFEQFYEQTLNFPSKTPRKFRVLTCPQYLQKYDKVLKLQLVKQMKNYTQFQNNQTLFDQVYEHYNSERRSFFKNYFRNVTHDNPSFGKVMNQKQFYNFFRTI